MQLQWGTMIRYWIHMQSFVTKTVEEDGIAFAMEHYGLIEG